MKWKSWYVSKVLSTASDSALVFCWPLSSMPLWTGPCPPVNTAESSVPWSPTSESSLCPDLQSRAHASLFTVSSRLAPFLPSAPVCCQALCQIQGCEGSSEDALALGVSLSHQGASAHPVASQSLRCSLASSEELCKDAMAHGHVRIQSGFSAPVTESLVFVISQCRVSRLKLTRCAVSVTSQ